MAVYGKDFYGLTKYGADIHVEYSVEPFEAQPDGYRTVRLSWSPPAGDWTRLRLLKNRLGYAVNASDGEILFDSETPINYWTDGDLTPGAWYYYTLYLEVDGVWNRVGVTSSLAIKDFGFAGLLWDRIPHYFHYVPRYPDGTVKTYFVSAEVYDPDRLDQINQHLQQFLTVLGWGFDFMRTYSDTTLWANHARLMHLENLDRLARTLGTTYEYEIPARLMRAKVANTALLARSRGTLHGLRDMLALSSGYDVEVEVGPNVMLNEDQANFASPVYDEWSPAINYPIGHRVQYSGRIMAAIAGAYGVAQKPPDAPTTSNTWWTVVTAQASEVLRDTATTAISTWKAFRRTAGTYPDNNVEPIKMGVGISSPVDTTVTNSNSLQVYNSTGASTLMHVWGAANPASNVVAQPIPEQVVRQGIPLGHPLAWDSAEEYLPGAFAVYGCRAFKALRITQGRAPDQYPSDWAQVGIDERPRLAFSFYSHADFDSTPGIAITPGVAFFDEHGALLDDLTTASLGAFFDTFNGTPDTPVTTHTPDVRYAAEQWTVQTYLQQANIATNLIANPSIEVDTAGWSGSNSTLARSTAQAYVGTASLSVTAIAAADAFALRPTGTAGAPVTPNTSYVVSGYFRAATTARSCKVGVTWYDAAGAAIGGSVWMPTGVNDTTTGWTRVTFATTSPANAAYASPRIVVAAPVAGEVHYLDAVMFETGTVASTYFDGDTADDTNYSYAWTGTAHASTSTKSLMHTGPWNVVEPSNIERVASPVDGSGILTVTLPTEKNLYKVAVTFKRPGLTGKTQALVLRYVDANNYLRVTRTAIEKMASGSLTTVATLSTPVADGDRVTVWMNETTNTQTVYVNDVQVAQATGQPQPAAGVGSDRYRHGLMVI